MPVLSDTAAEEAIDDMLASVSHLSLHTGYSATGTLEASGGSPPYGREPVAWDAAASRLADNTGAVTFDVAAATDVEFVGFWDADTAGNFYGMTPLNSSLALTCNIWNTGDLLEYPTHGLSDDDTIVIMQLGSTATPSGITEGDIYYVISSSTNDFQISTSMGGGAVSITSDGQAIIMDITEQSFGTQGTLTIDAGSLDVEATQ